ncbi:hypothetical protein SynBIOSE41_04347 [Synechococcus sp. BIOS-E4-1]|nr:hypothetical protein SynBIOSE41_04347 [Synechococcus sp. BIOS-E4-1]
MRSSSQAQLISVPFHSNAVDISDRSTGIILSHGHNKTSTEQHY